MTKASPMTRVDFHNPPRIGHTPGVLDGRRYKLGWDFRKSGVRREDIHDRDEFTGWFDADNAIRLGRDIGQTREAPCE